MQGGSLNETETGADKAGWQFERNRNGYIQCVMVV